MSDALFAALLTLLFSTSGGQYGTEPYATIVTEAQSEAVTRGYADWQEAFVEFVTPTPPAVPSSLDSDFGAVRLAEYDEKTSQLIVTLASGQRWRYVSVPPQVMLELRDSGNLSDGFARRVQSRYRGAKMP